MLGAITARLHAEGLLCGLGRNGIALALAALTLASIQLTTLSLLSVLGFALLTASLASGGAARWLERPSWRWLGEISLGIYLLHAPLQLALHDILARYGLVRVELSSTTALGLLLALVVALLLLAWAVACWLERPARLAIRERWAARRCTAATAFA